MKIYEVGGHRFIRLSDVKRYLCVFLGISIQKGKSIREICEKNNLSYRVYEIDFWNGE